MKVVRCFLYLALPLATAPAVVKFSMKDIEGTNVDAPHRSLVETPLFQVDPNITRVELIGAHSKWLFCSSAYWQLTNRACETKQPYVPEGYWFETGRDFRLPKRKKCGKLRGNEPFVPTVVCRFKKGLTMVLPVVNYIDVACNDTGSLLEPKSQVRDVWDHLVNMRIIKATLDGVTVSPDDAIPVIAQDGDATYGLPGPTGCIDNFGILTPLQGCPLVASGQYVFIDTKRLAKKTHELILIGEDATGSGFCSAVRHVFTLT